jgi:hypothetical protein
MEEVLEVYKRPYDESCPVVCFDETSKQLVREIQAPLPAVPGQVEKFDYEYERNGVGNLFMLFEPLAGWRKVKTTNQRTRADFANCMKDIVDIHYPKAPTVTVVLDNLNTHGGASLYQTFPPDEARRILDRIEFCHTPKHGSWLNMAEIELSVLSKQCLDRRIPNQEVLANEVGKWERDRNRTAKTMDWQFKTEDARIKLKRLYPSIQNG